MSKNSPWEDLYATAQHQSVWPWSDLVSLVMRHVVPAHENGFRVLDLGCGMGANIPFFQTLGAEYYGVDISQTAISTLQERFPDIADNMAVTDFTREIPFDGPFDLVVDRGSLTHNTSDAIKQSIALIEERMQPSALFVGVHWFSTEHSDFTKGEPTEDPYCRTNFTDGSFADVGVVHFTDEAHLRSLLAEFELIKLYHTLTDHVVPGDGARIAYWNFVGRKSKSI